jgi:hypothetical protein
MAESSPVELGKLKPVKPLITPAQAKAITTGVKIAADIVGPGKIRNVTRAVRLAKEAREIAEKAAGFSKPKVIRYPEEEVTFTPAKKIEAKLEEKRLKRGVEEPKSTPAPKNLAVEKAQAFGLGSVSPQQRAAIEAQMNKGLRPDMGPLRFDPMPPSAVNIRPPLAPGVRKWTPETPRVTSKMPKPSIPGVKILDIKSSGVAPKVTRPKDELPETPKPPLKAAKNIEVRDSNGRLIFKATPEEMQNINEKLKNAKEAEERGLKIFSDSTVRNSGTSVERSPDVIKEKYWYENAEDANEAAMRRWKREGIEQIVKGD